MKKTCSCGLESKEFSDTGSVGDIVKETGFFAVLTHVGRILYLCSKCHKEACELAEKILVIVKDKHLYFPNLIGKRK